jgi:hypothetical protein
MYSPPQFAFTADGLTGPYLKAVKLTHNYHFPTNRPVSPAVYLEIRLKDAQGQDLGTFKLPDPNVNPWVRHRQKLLAEGLGGDIPVLRPQAESIPAPGQQVPRVTYWEQDQQQGNLKLEEKPENLLPNDRPVMRPSDVSMILAQSYARHLCRTQGAASAEIIRHHKDPIPPAVMSLPDIPAGAFEEMRSHFGEFPPKDAR